MKIMTKDLYFWIRNIKNKKVIIFGTDTRAEKLYHKLRLLDIKAEYFVDDVIEENPEGLCGCDIYNYHELLYEEFDKIGLVIMEPANLEKLIKIGVYTGENVDNCFLTFAYNTMEELQAVDPTVGYNNVGDKEYPGFISFGDRDAKYTIVTLGGSTTDVVYAATIETKCWSEYLAEKLKSEGLSVRILCGGVAGWKCSQELLKLIRDVIPLKPDMVIVYDGYNELNSFWENRPEEGFYFLSTYQMNLFSVIGQNIPRVVSRTKHIFGINADWDFYTAWKNYTIMMHVICENFGIKHISVLQPTFYNQYDKLGGKSDREILLNVRMGEDCKNGFRHFYDEKDQDEWHPEWLKDFRTIFQGIDEVFYDFCHVYNKGNEIIADRLLDFVKQELA